MGLDTDTVQLCYRSGWLGWVLLMMVKFASLTAWANLTGFAIHTKELFFFALSQSVWFSITLQFIVAAYIVQAKPDHHCNNDVLSSPPLIVWLLYHYLGMLVVFELLENIPNEPSGAISKTASPRPRLPLRS